MPRHSVYSIIGQRQLATTLVTGTMRSCLFLYTAPELWTYMLLLDSGPANILYDLPT